MPTITAGDFRNGVTFEKDGSVCTVVEFQHVKPGKGAAFVRTKYKNVMTGAIREESFNPTAKFEQATVERKDAEYSYNDGDLYYFMDPETYDMVPLNRDVLGDAFRFVKENTVCKLAISLSDLLDEVSVDAARWYFNAKPDTQMEFDLGLAVREDSENPIYYVEYAHARICSLLRALAEEGTSVPRQADVDMSLLSGEAERALLKQIAQFCEEIKLAARDYDPSHINRYLQELAACFHRFYTACRIKGEEPAVRDARLKLADDTRIVLRNGLKLIGVDAPEKM